jgi:hypothetical protein
MAGRCRFRRMAQHLRMQATILRHDRPHMENDALLKREPDKWIAHLKHIFQARPPFGIFLSLFPPLSLVAAIMATTALPALTDVFTPPSTCFSTIINVGSDDILGPYPTPTECYPPGYNFAVLTGSFSPGLECPSGYTTATNSVLSINTVSETIVNCCPSCVPSHSSAPLLQRLHSHQANRSP